MKSIWDKIVVKFNSINNIANGSKDEEDIKNFFGGGKSKLSRFFISLLQHIHRDNITQMAGQLAYNMLLAMIPLILVFIQGVMIFFPNVEQLFYKIITTLPFEVGDFIKNLVPNLIHQTNTATISVSLFTSLWLASKGIRTIIANINKAFGLKERRDIVELTLLSIFYTLIMVLFIIGLFILKFFNDNYLSQFFTEDLVYFKWVSDIVKDVSSNLTDYFPYFLMLLFFTFFYKSAPATSKEKKVLYREALVGGVFSTLASLLVTNIYSYIMTNISKWNIYFGSFATVMAFLVWFLMINHIFILGGEVVAAYIKVFKEKRLRSKNKGLLSQITGSIDVNKADKNKDSEKKD